MERIIILQHAKQSVECMECAKIEESVFGVLRSVLKSTSEVRETGSFVYERNMFQYILKLSNEEGNYNYMGVKLVQLQEVIKVLYCDQADKILPDSAFCEYSSQDLMVYSEICRRMHKIKVYDSKKKV